MQRPANDWEWHILGEVAKRVNKSAPHLSSSYMTVSRFFSSKTRNLVKSVQGVSLSPMEVFLCPNWPLWDLFSTWSTWQTRTKLSPNLLPFTSQPRYSKYYVCTSFASIIISFSDFGTCASIALDGPDPRRLEAGQLPGHRPSRHGSSIPILEVYSILYKTSLQAFTIGLCKWSTSGKR